MPFEIPTKVIIAVLVLIALPLVPYVLGPILIHMNLRQKAKPTTGTFPLDDPHLPEELASFFRKAVQALQPLGFEG